MWKALKCWELIQIRVIFKELYGLIWGEKIPKLEKYQEVQHIMMAK